MRQTVLFQLKIFVAVILDRVALGVKDGGPPVTNCATTRIAVLGVTNVSTRKLELTAASADNDIRPFQAVSMVFV